jgi:hypothetical protein
MLSAMASQFRTILMISGQCRVETLGDVPELIGQLLVGRVTRGRQEFSLYLRKA